MNKKAQKDNLVTNEEQAFNALETEKSFFLDACKRAPDLENRTRFTKIHLNSLQKMQISALLQQTPHAIATGSMAKALWELY